VVKVWVLGVVVLLTSVSASAQTSRAADAETIRQRQRIALIEGMLERAVQNGVDNFSRQIQAHAPNADGMAMLMGAPQVRGFRGVDPNSNSVFFDVLMPSLQLSMVFSLRSQGVDPAALAKLSDLRSELERLTDPQMRLELTQQVREIEMQLSGPPQTSRRRGPATTVANVQGSAAGAASAVSPSDIAILDDPAEAWRREVRSTLIDAMIENIGLNIGPDDYIVIAARGVLSSDRLVADAGDARTIEFRLKGSDLAAYRAQAITLEEARKRVSIREY
jgi:hypothetical protein